ncbi:Aldehyde/histidinol dehydrogenase [Exophiala viscosa]|uniref:aldehyde dehydrogenase (NAD(+)) n=1 Tax=Exophiala viscosa TaxID=2486360 RepID=A0AAN6DQN4_9EURO|nr:Aldehyde/histidinol dehydrogenase [Exophiala viscosa]
MSPSKLETISFDTFANIVNGQSRSSKTTYHGVDPTTKQPNWEAPVASAEDVEDAVAAVNKAFEQWKTTTWEFRSARMVRFKEIFEAYKSEMVDLLIKETGKPPAGATIEFDSCLAVFDWHIKMEEPQGEVIDTPEKRVVNRFVPLGVVAAICPWNFPLIHAMGKVLPAVLMGNTIIVHISQVVELANQIFPPGVIQVLGGDEKLGPALVEHPRIHKIACTGSTATGKKVLAAAAKTVKRCTLEMSGNDASIVLPDADIGEAAQKVALGAFINTSQVCTATKRIYVHSSIYDIFLAVLVQIAQSLKVGAPDEEGVVLGPVQNEMQYERVKHFFRDSQAAGYKFALGSGDVADSKGFYVHPTIIDNPPDESLIVQEEPYGPIVPVLKYDDLEDAIRRANDTKSGLGASVHGKDPEVLAHVAERLEAGSVWINGLPFPSVEAHFGGWKESGMGTEFGRNGVLAYANTKAIHTFTSI